MNIYKIGRLNIHSYKNKLEKNINYAITKGKFNFTKSIPVRVLSNKLKVKIINNKNIKKSLIAMSKYKNFLLLVINNKNNISRENSIYTLNIMELCK